MDLENSVDEATQARLELSDRVAHLGAVLVDTVKDGAHELVGDVIETTESRLAEVAKRVNPRALIRARPLTTAAGALGLGFWMVARRSMRPQASLGNAALRIGFSLLNAYAASRVNRLARGFEGPPSGGGTPHF